MKLEDCTKDELIHFIRERGIYIAELFELDILFYRAGGARKQWNYYEKEANKAMEHWISLTNSYKGKDDTEIPVEVYGELGRECESYKRYIKLARKEYKRWGRINKRIDELLKDEDE